MVEYNGKSFEKFSRIFLNRICGAIEIVQIYYERKFTVIFDRLYTQSSILESALQAYSVRDNVIQNNIANAETPNFKRKTVVFENYLADALKEAKRTGTLSLREAKARIVEVNPNLTFHSNGNNVDIETENVDLYTNSVLYDTTVNSIIQNGKRLSLVLGLK